MGEREALRFELHYPVLLEWGWSLRGNQGGKSAWRAEVNGQGWRFLRAALCPRTKEEMSAS